MLAAIKDGEIYASDSGWLSNELDSFSRLLRKQVATEGNSPVECHSGEVRAILALALGPARDRRDHGAKHAASGAQHPVVSANQANLHSVISPLGAQADERNEPPEFVPTYRLCCDARHVSYLLGELDFTIRGNHRAAVRDEELQQSSDGDNDDECGNHRAPATNLAVASRAFSGTLVNVYAQASGSHVPMIGIRALRKETLGKRLRSAYNAA